eukprot:2066633-Rhodomonas_salina.1
MEPAMYLHTCPVYLHAPLYLHAQQTQTLLTSTACLPEHLPLHFPSRGKARAGWKRLEGETC